MLDYCSTNPSEYPELMASSESDEEVLPMKGRQSRQRKRYVRNSTKKSKKHKALNNAKIENKKEYKAVEVLRRIHRKGLDNLLSSNG